MNIQTPPSEDNSGHPSMEVKENKPEQSDQNRQILEVIKLAHREMDLPHREYRGAILAPLALKDFGSELISWVDPQGLCVLVLPVVSDIAPERRQAVGELLHRLDFRETRKLWEFDYNSGDVRLTAYTDVLTITSDTQAYKDLIDLIKTTADVVYPYLTAVLSAKMAPDFAADQANAALAVAFNSGPEDFEDDDE